MAEDEWGEYPEVQFMRRVFAAIEMEQGALLGRLNIHRTDGGLRLARRMALNLFEQIWGRAANQGVRLREHDVAHLYTHCLAKVLQAGGTVVPDGFLSDNDIIKKLMENAR